MAEDLTQAYFLRHFTTTMTLAEWEVLYPAVVNRRESVNLKVNGQPRQVTITGMKIQPVWTEDNNVYLTGHYDDRHMEQ